MEKSVDSLLDSALEAMSLNLPEMAKQQLIDYLKLIYQWNKAFNLTAIRQIEEMVIKHILDSLSIGPYVSGKRVLDAGTGAGLPGIPLAIIYPEKVFFLLDSNGKKTRFLTHAASTLKLKNVTIIQARAEKFLGDIKFDHIISRAFAELKKMLTFTRHLLAPNGQFLAMKGAYPEEELKNLPAQYKLLKTYKLEIPYLQAERHLICIGIREQSLLTT